MPDTQLTRPRLVRVFVSSTFRDMRAEREELVKIVFPKLRKLCQQRGVLWGEVDLRWGVTDEQTAEGQVLPICLEEIKACRPYFIGLLGERYGWVPDHIRQDLVEREPWLAQHREKSVTELEIFHGVLNNLEMESHAFFYFRDPKFAQATPVDERSNYIAESPAAAEKLGRLKDRIRASKFPLRENYPDPSALGDLVLEDLTGVIDRLFPAGAEIDPLDREAAAQQEFAQTLARAHVSRKRYFDLLDEFAGRDGPPLVVLGDSGAGKSALLAAWALQRLDAGPDEKLTVMHFVGATPESSHWALSLRRIMAEMGRRLGIARALPDLVRKTLVVGARQTHSEELPDTTENLRAEFANWLALAAAKGPIVIIIDALNLLEDQEGALSLAWLPTMIPANVRLIVSTGPGRSLDELTKREWPRITVEPLTVEERRDLIADYLEQFRKVLAPIHVARISSASQSANPRFLCALLEELRVFGEHEQLDQRISHYLSAGTVVDLYQKILQRYETDYERGRPQLVRDAVSLLWAARWGLSESELLEFLRRDGEDRLPLAVWAPLQLAADQLLISKSGLIGFYGEDVREAVRARYLPAKHQQVQAHETLADRFYLTQPGPRRTSELPWQLAKAEAWERLFSLLADPVLLKEACLQNLEDVQTSWARLEARTSPNPVLDILSTLLKPGDQLTDTSRRAFQMTEAYRAQIERPGDEPDKDLLRLLALLLDKSGRRAEAGRIWNALVDHWRTSGDLFELKNSLFVQASMMREAGELTAAMTILKEAQQACSQLGDMDGLQASLGNQAQILAEAEELDEAFGLLKLQETLCRELGYLRGLSTCLLNQGQVLIERRKFDEAITLFKEAEQASLQSGNLGGRAFSLNGLALVFHELQRFDEAGPLLIESESIFRQLGNLRGLALVLSNQARAARDTGKFEKALSLLQQSERIWRQLGDSSQLSNNLTTQGSLLQNLAGKRAGCQVICLRGPSRTGLLFLNMETDTGPARLVPAFETEKGANEFGKAVEKVFGFLPELFMSGASQVEFERLMVGTQLPDDSKNVFVYEGTREFAALRKQLGGGVDVPLPPNQPAANTAAQNEKPGELEAARPKPWWKPWK